MDNRFARIAQRQRRAEKSAYKENFTTPPPDDSGAIPMPKNPHNGPAPSWWTRAALLPSSNPGSFATVANAVLPFLASPDQEAVRTFLATQAGFGSYLTGATGQTAIAPRASVQTKQQFFNATRARELLTTLDNMRNEAKLTEDQLGPGYKFLRRAVDLLQQFGISGNEQSMTRAETEQLQTQLAAMAEQARSDRTLAPYAELATQFLNPTTIGDLNPTSQINGRTIYGRPNNKLFA